MEKPLPKDREPSVDELLVPVPSFVEARIKKPQYRDYPIDIENPLYRDPTLDIASYNIAGQSYWARPNEVFDEPISQAPDNVLLRKGVLDILQRANEILSHQDFVEYFDGPVEIYVEDGLRSAAYQQFLYDVAFPGHINANNPSWSEEQVMKRRDELIAAPAKDFGLHPTPHMTGAAVDITIRFKQDTLKYVDGSSVEMLRDHGDPGIACNPDFAEDLNNSGLYDEITWAKGRDNRRLIYNLMSSLGMQVNPTEYWHWSYGDQMWALFKDQPAALYGAVVDAE